MPPEEVYVSYMCIFILQKTLRSPNPELFDLFELWIFFFFLNHFYQIMFWCPDHLGGKYQIREAGSSSLVKTGAA